MNPALSSLYFNLVAPLARRLHFIRADSLYHLAGYCLKGRAVRGIVDGGAFDGKHSLYLARLFPRATIFAFEPAPESYKLLAEAAKRSSRIVPLQLALTESAGTAMLNINTFAPTNSFLASRSNEDARTYFDGRGDTISSAAVQTVSLDEFARREKNFRCTLLKLDLQGYELPALHGAREVLLQQVEAVISEVRFKPLYHGDAHFEAIDSYLAGCGFSLRCLQEVTPHPKDNTVFEANALWVKR